MEWWIFLETHDITWDLHKLEEVKDMLLLVYCIQAQS